MKKRRIMASFLALLISISSFFNIGFAQTDLNINVDENLSEEKIVLELDGKEIKENENGEIIVNFEDIKDGNGILKYIGNRNIPEGKVGIWVETGMSNPEAILLEQGWSANLDGSITLKRKTWDTEIEYGIVYDEFEEFIEPQNVIKKVKIKIVTNDPNYIDTSELEKIIIEGKEYLSYYEALYYKEEYIKKLENLIEESKKLLEKEDLKKEEIDLQINKLKPVVENPEKKEFDKTELNKFLKQAEAINKENYTKDSYKKVECAVQNVKSQNDKFKTQSEVDFHVKELEKAINGLIDRSKLGKAIVRAEELEKGSLSEDSWTNFQEALKEAKEVYGKEAPSYCMPWSKEEECKELTKEDIDKSLEKLNSAICLLSTGDKSALKIAIEKVEDLKESEFKPESIEGKEKLLNDVKVIYTDSNATQEQINQAVKKIENWLSKLEKKYVVYYETVDGRRINLDSTNSIELDLSKGGGRFCLEGKLELKDEDEIYWVYDYDKSDTVAYTSMKEGELYLKGVGETTIQLKITNDFSYEHDPAIVTINLKVTEIPKIEDIKVCVGGKEVQDKIIIEGSQSIPLEIKAKFEGENDYIRVDRTKFKYHALNERNDGNPSDTGDKDSIIHLYNYNEFVMGIIISERVGNTTLVVEFPRDKIKKEIPVEVKHVPVEEIYFNIPEKFEYFELGHAPGCNNGIYLVTDVIGVKPENATYEGEIQFKFSDDSIARHQPLYGDYIEPRKDGTVDITAYLDTDGKHFEVTRTVKFYKKKIAVEKIQATNEEIEVKVDEIVPIGIETVPKDASNQEFDYKVSKDGIVEIIGNSIKGLKEGTVEIEAKSKDTNSKNAAKVTVKVLPKGEARDIKKETKEAIEKSTHLLQKDKFEVGEEWNVFGLARNDENLISKEQKDDYVNSIVESMKKRNRFSVKGKPTDIERLVIALTSIGKDVENVNGENLLRNIYQNPNISNGSNEAIFALIALDTLNYKVPDNAMWSRNELIEEVKRYQNPNGGFGLFDNKTASIDMTAMALQALSTYKDRDDVKPVIEKALDYLRENQTEYGGFIDYGKENAESAAQVLVALTSLGIDPLDPSNKFGDENYNIVTNILSYRNLEDGGFKHWKEDTKSNGMATTQSYYALVSYLRFVEGKNKLYDMRDEKIDGIEDDLTIVSVDSIEDVIVEYGTEKENLELPEKITLKLSDGSEKEVNVNWINEKYDGNKAGEYTFIGSYDLPEGVTGEKPEVNVKVRVKEEPRPEVNKDKLKEIINKTEKLDLENKAEESIKALNEAIAKGKEILNKKEMTQEDVDSAVKNIKVAIEDLKDEEKPEPTPEVDKTRLKEVLNKAERTDIKDKTEESIKDLNNAISKGKEIFESKTATQEEVNKTLELLKAAING
ncbi:MAG: FIVAR domain-containing protein, partial [Clostridiaceae bacterium]|nr:FIVAR domain-containing protein [Clostridiaceae bacterium]MBW4859941.1 FIVAR domain-containing protein [Clostridiaceae bacterium]MBW4869325.1 FIVAR domain-containing protein [Clostridiaceae bacterium]